MYAYRDWIVFAHGRIYACMCVSRARESVDEREKERERGRARSGSESRAGTGANWSRLVCSIFVPNYPLPLPSPPPRHLPPFVLSLFRPSPLIPYLRLSPPDRASHRPVLLPRARVSIYPALATAQPLYRPLALLISFPLSHRLSLRLAPLLDSACTVSELLGTLA